MQQIIRFKSEDGLEFENRSECMLHELQEKLVKEFPEIDCKDITDLLDPIVDYHLFEINKINDFRTSEGYYDEDQTMKERSNL